MILRISSLSDLFMCHVQNIPRMRAKQRPTSFEIAQVGNTEDSSMPNGMPTQITIRIGDNSLKKGFKGGRLSSLY